MNLSKLVQKDYNASVQSKLQLKAQKLKEVNKKKLDLTTDLERIKL